MLAGAAGTPAVITSRSYSTSGLDYAWSVDTLYRSTDGGRTFVALHTPVHASIEAVREDAGGVLYVGFLQLTSQGTTGGLFTSRDHGTTWTHLGVGTALDRGVFSL